eukprot:1975808-Pleurochrysis_carterae.AAC.1
MRDILGDGGAAAVQQRGRWASDVAQIYQRAVVDGQLRSIANLADAAGLDLEALRAGQRGAGTAGRATIRVDLERAACGRGLAVGGRVGVARDARAGGAGPTGAHVASTDATFAHDGRAMRTRRARALRAHSTRASSARRLRIGHPLPRFPFGTAAGPLL